MIEIIKWLITIIATIAFLIAMLKGD